jgi:hypothetical protein
MPCGGIGPSDSSGMEGYACFYCGKVKHPVTGKVVDHFVEEWDAALHRSCIEPFLITDEGEIMLSHEHDVVVTVPGGETLLLFKDGKRVAEMPEWKD